MSNHVMYLGGMILGDIDAHYRYERALAQFLKQRNAMFHPASGTFWGKNRVALWNLEEQANFPDDAYHYLPSDPLVHLETPDGRVMLLKRRYLNRLRMRLLKQRRQGH